MAPKAYLSIAISALLSAAGCGGGKPLITLSAMNLYTGFKAENIALDSENAYLTLDNRSRTDQFVGEIVTDPIDLWDLHEAPLALKRSVKNLSAEVVASVPTGTRISLEYQSGPNYYTFDEWTGWEPAKNGEIQVKKPGDRYLRLKLVLSGQERPVSPSLSAIKLSGEQGPAPIFRRKVEVEASEIQDIVTSPYAFSYESRDNEDVKAFVKRNRLSDLVAGKTKDFDIFMALNSWVARTRNSRHGTWERDYPWDLKELITEVDGQFAIKGHCMSYAVVLISALSGLGYHARHWAINGFRDMDHEVVEVWSDQYRKWIYLDPSLDQHYTDPKTDVPLSLLEMHRVFVSTFFERGETLKKPMSQQRETIKAIGGKNAPIQCVYGGYHYGKKTENYDWGWLHGYLAAGFLRLTTRNNFHSQKEPWFSHFGEGVADFDVYLSWVDEKTPPKSDKITRFSGRERDFYWTLNQAAFRVIRSGEKTLDLELGNSQPFFDHYAVEINGKNERVTANRYEWKLSPGNNTLSVTPVDKWGHSGLPSRMAVTLF